MPKRSPSPHAMALTYFRRSAGLSMIELAQVLGHSDKSLVSAYERDAKPLAREQLDSLVTPLGYSREAVDLFLSAHRVIQSQESPGESNAPASLTSEESRFVERAAMAAARTAGRVAAEIIRDQGVRLVLEGKKAAHSKEQLLRSLLPLSRKERHCLVEAFPKYKSLALAVEVCEASIRSAARNAGEALELAELAVSIAERGSGEEPRRMRLQGYCWAHVANARRVANDLVGAEEALTRAWELWRGGSESGPESELLAEWRLYDLEGSLRRAQRRFPEALASLDRARAACKGDPFATGRILVNRERVLNQKGDIEEAVATLKEAAPFVEASGDPHLVFALRFNMADDLCHLERFDEAGKSLPQVRDLAIQQGNELDLIRVVWLTAKVTAGEGRREEAIAGLEQVNRDFAVRRMPYDAALSSLDLSVLWLKAGHTREVKQLAVAMGWIFKAQGIDREALAALELFCTAARRERATVELARKVIADIEQVRRSAS